jgi:uroporphyrinogen decarboxylase
MDEWGVTYRKNGWPIIAQVDTPVKSREDWQKYFMPEVKRDGRLKILNDVIKANDAGLAVTAGFLGPFTMMSWYLMDFETLSMTIFMDPGLIHEMTDAFVRWALEAAELAWATGGVDAFHISDDWGGTHSLLISPEHFREFFIAPFHKLVSGLKSYGIPVIMHNDGNLWEILDDLAATGIDAYHPVEKAAGMDLVTVKERYHGHICPIGNVNNKTTMVSGKADDVMKETIECLRHGAPGGGYILSTDHSLHDDISLENVKALIDTVLKYGNYPISLPDP